MVTDRERIDGLFKIAGFFEARADMAVGDAKMLLLNWMKCAREAAEALEKQTPAELAPRLLAFDELAGHDGAVFVEYNPEKLNNAGEWVFVDYTTTWEKPARAWLIRKSVGNREVVSYRDVGYNVAWRCWTRRPGEALAAAAPWKELEA